MAAKIRILTEQLANKIAAGEVVERPASVVKELIENSLDAGASEVVIEIADGGKRLISVSDNGCGMSREDALMCLERHATSKIRSDSDLFALGTLGFRGEALPSIASVSRFTLSSRENSALEGVELYCEGGKVRNLQACGMPVGTSISVRNLFFNTPARLKFMRSRETESSHVHDVIIRLALSRPDVRFFFKSDQKQILTLLSGDIVSRSREVLGANLAKEMHYIETEENGIQLIGLIGSPSVTRSSASAVYTFINGRYVRDRVVQHAVLQAFRNILERGRYPVLVLFIGLSPDDVDVNVHPTKHEVRFREQSKVHQVVNGIIESFLRRTPWLEKSFGSSHLPAYPQKAEKVESVRDALLRYTSTPSVQQSSLFRLDHPTAGISMIKETVSCSSGLKQTVEAAGYFSSLGIIGQFQASYLLCQDEVGLVIIDQHAAHERVVFEELRLKFTASSLTGQQLLFSETVELMPIEASVLQEQYSLVSRLGFELEHFGGATWLLNTVPQVLVDRDYKRALRDILEEVIRVGSSTVITDVVDEILTSIACHSVIRGEWRLTENEILHLLKRMDVTDFSTNCPHGRPAVARISVRDIEKLFHR